MCYSTKPRCSKHGLTDQMHTEWQGDTYIAKCQEPGCTFKLTFTRSIITDDGGKVHVNYSPVIVNE